MFKQCRDAFPNKKIWLIAGVCSQRDVLLRKGKINLIKAQLLARNNKDTKWLDSVSGLMRFMKVLHGTSPNVLISNNIEFLE